MKKFFLLSVAATLICSLSFATIRRVGFFGPLVSGVDYTTLQLAHNAASAGDTIMMMPGSSTDATLTKSLVIIGPGFFLNPADVSFPGNAGLQANSNSTNQDVGLNFGAGSSNSQVIGCAMNNVQFNVAGLTNILIKRCWMTSNGGFAVYFNQSGSNFTFQQCVFRGYPQTFGSVTSLTNISFLNCVFDSHLILSTGSNSGLINNCVFTNPDHSISLGSGAWQVSNCISRAAAFNGTNIVYNNNIGTSTQFPAGNGNQQNKAWNTIFNLTGSYDGKYALKAGSPAIGAGVNGAAATDCGIFGGATPYRLSGIPSVPTIYSLTSPQGTIPAGNTVQINLSTRSNN